jgi:hypothetical protein
VEKVRLYAISTAVRFEVYADLVAVAYFGCLQRNSAPAQQFSRVRKMAL